MKINTLIGILVLSLLVMSAPSAQMDAKLSTGAVLYLETTFCNDDLCGVGGWSRWIIADANSVWTAEELATVRDILRHLAGSGAIANLGARFPA